MFNSIFAEFLAHTSRAAHALAARSDIVRVLQLPIPEVGMFLVRFALPYLAARPDGTIAVAPGPLHAAIRFDPGYLHHVSPLEVVQVQEQDLFHPNCLWPVVCIGALRPGMSLSFVIRHLFELFSYSNYATDDGLNPVACARLREEPGLLRMLPPRPRLVRRPLDLERTPDELSSAG